MEAGEAAEPAPPKKSSRRTFGGIGDLVHRRIIAPILGINDSHHSIAMGVALGLFVAFTPTVGLQMLMVVAIGTVLRANRIAGCALTWISNVVTMIPLYWFYYVIGRTILGREGITYDALDSLMRNDAELSSWGLCVEVFHQLGWPLWLGSLIVATLIGVPAYPLTLRYLKARERRRLAEKEAARSAAEAGE